VTVLLAKSRAHGELTLQQHLIDTELAATSLFRADSRWGQRWPQFFKLDPADPRFLLELRVAALFHDIGKANEDFQRAVTGTAFFPQTLRHEHLSALIMCLPVVRRWLAPSTIDVDLCTAAVLSHHLKAEDQDGEWVWGQFQNSPTLRLHLDDPQVRETLRRVSELLGLAEAPPLPPDVITSQARGVWLEALQQGVEAARKFGRTLKKDPERRRRSVAVKVGLIVSDAAASGLFRTGNRIDAWINSVAHAEALSAERIAADIIGARLSSIGGGASLQPFQVRASETGPRTLLLAACGSGKTLAAWKWAEAQARARPLGRVIFLYPTRGTATEGFRDYAAWAPEGEATLLHGTAEYELEKMHENPSDSVRGKQLADSEAESRLYALALWSKRYFSATVDQFLGAMEHRYESLCLLPALADAAVIIDEVHSFDPRMFASLIAFLKEFDVPILCMTATLPSGRREELEHVGLRSFPSKEESVELADLSAKERAPRYRLKRVPGAIDAMEIAAAAFREGKRVLWVVNQVAGAQALTRSLSAQLGTRVLCYHSRFRLMDRQRAHQETVQSFQQTTRAAIAVTTQVCEMSLDLDADVLVTEECPVTSLVQRFGRANRHLARPGILARLVTYPADGDRPYSKGDLAGVQEFLAGLDGTELCQADLAARLENLDLDETSATGASSLFDSGFYAVPREFRDIDEFARASVLRGDVDEVERRLKAGKSIAGFIVPVPRRFAALPTGTRLPAWLGVAETEHYEASLGFVAPERKVT
jgi:CRISPR-associated endonuclease/helicase Cas3